MVLQIILATFRNAVNTSLRNVNEQSSAQVLAYPIDAVANLRRRAAFSHQRTIFLTEVEMVDECVLHLLCIYVLVANLQQEWVEKIFKYWYCHVDALFE